jgi:hypothetical protein
MNKKCSRNSLSEGREKSESKLSFRQHRNILYCLEGQLLLSQGLKAIGNEDLDITKCKCNLTEMMAMVNERIGNMSTS